jgi:hypothetical protein
MGRLHALLGAFQEGIDRQHQAVHLVGGYGPESALVELLSFGIHQDGTNGIGALDRQEPPQLGMRLDAPKRQSILGTGRSAHQHKQECSAQRPG